MASMKHKSVLEERKKELQELLRPMQELQDELKEVDQLLRVYYSQEYQYERGGPDDR